MPVVPMTAVDDINRLAGDEFGEWGPIIEITQEMVDQFAELTGDRQWIHVDPERCARESPFGGPIAHGFLTISLLPALFPPGTLELSGARNEVNFGSDGLRFLAPVPVGSSIHARSRIIGAELHRSGTLVTTETAVHVVANDKPSLTYRAKVLYQG